VVNGEADMEVGRGQARGEQRKQPVEQQQRQGKDGGDEWLAAHHGLVTGRR
jgi:hypothetical protein